MDNSGSWFTRYGVHTIVAATITALIAIGGANCISNNISKANLVRSIIPDLVSKDPYKISLALYAVEIGISKKHADEIARKIGYEIGSRAVLEKKNNNIQASKRYLDAADYMSPLVYDSAVSRIKDISKKTSDQDSVRDLLEYKPQPYNISYPQYLNIAPSTSVDQEMK